MIATSRASLGVQGTKKAEQLRRQRERMDDWPYVHIFPPPNSIPVHQINSTPVVVPAINTTATVLSYQVGEGFRFYMIGILETLFTGGPGMAPGDLLWTVTVNTPGGLDSQAAPVQGLINTPVPLGQWNNGVWWPLPRAYEFGPDSVVRSTCFNATGNIPGSLPNVLVSGFFGWLLPDGQQG